MTRVPLSDLNPEKDSLKTVMETPPPTTPRTEPTDADVEAFKQQLGRPPRGLRAIAHRCPCGQPDVVETAPRLPDGTPFPTLYYLTCPKANSAIGTLEANGVMKEMTERHLVRDGVVSDPPTEAQIAAMRADIEAALDLAEQTVPLREARTLVGLAGSVTTVSAIAQELPEYDSEAIHHSRVSHERVREITEWLLRSTHAERAAVPSMHPGRVDVIGAGALVLLSIMERIGAQEVVVSEHDILDGIAWSVA